MMPTSTIVRRTLRDSAFLGVLISSLLLVGSIRLAGIFVAGAALATVSFLALALTVERSMTGGTTGGAALLLLPLGLLLKMSLVGMIFVLLVRNDGPGALVYLCGLSTVPLAACVAGIREKEPPVEAAPIDGENPKAGDLA